MNLLLMLVHLFWETIRHQKKIFLVTFVAVFLPMGFAIHRLPKRFQTSAIFNFHSDFSKIPASSEFFPEMYDPNEIRAEKEAILLGVLSDDFLYQLVQKYFGETDAEHEWVVQGLRKDIRFVPLSRTSYQLIVVQRSADMVEKIAWEVIEKLEDILKSERLARMQAVFDSITQQLHELTIDGQDKDMLLHMEANRLKVEEEINKLERLYTAEHPRLIRLRAQLKNLHKSKQNYSSDGLARGQLENWASLRGILLTRQALLQVAIRMEEKGSLSHIKLVKEPDLPQWPVEPKKHLLLTSAAVTSTVLATAVAACCSFARDARVLFPEAFQAWNRFRASLLNKRKINSTAGQVANRENTTDKDA
ncbi:hypothetical protein EBU99_05820 [bacterium]|nr:hypothetical protein [bacterium]